MLGQGSVGGGLQTDARASGQTKRDVTGRNRNGKSLALSLFFFFVLTFFFSPEPQRE